MTSPALVPPRDHAHPLRNGAFGWLRPDDLSIPMLPDQAQRVLALVGSPDVTIATLAGVVSKDPALATRVLGMANSAMHGAMAPLRTVSDAVVRLGTRAVRNVVVTVSMQSQFEADVYGAEGTRFMEHAVGTAYTAHLVAERVRANTEEAFLCGLLHDIGKLVILRTASEARRRGESIAPDDVREAMSQHHALCGALALAHWHVPDDVREVVRCHHAFEDANEPLQAAICYAANLLSHRYGFGCPALGDAVLEDGVFAYLELDAEWIAMADGRAPGLVNAARSALR